MIDKKSKRFIKFLREQPDSTFMLYDEYPDEIGEADDLFALIDFLETKKLISKVLSKGDLVGVTLTHTARNKYEFYLINFISYIKDNWIAILALTISAAALIRTF